MTDWLMKDFKLTRKHSKHETLDGYKLKQVIKIEQENPDYPIDSPVKPTNNLIRIREKRSVSISQNLSKISKPMLDLTI